MESYKIVLIALLGAAVIGTVVYTTTLHKTPMLQAYPTEVINAYKNWQTKYNKKQSDPDVGAYRLGVFYKNYMTIKNHPKTETYTLGENQFMDLTNAEFKATYLGLLPKKEMSSNIHVDTGVNAGSVDWRTKGAVSAIKDQGQCGSCWAFSTTGSLESADFIQKGTLGNFSEQQLVDCSSSYGNMGCNGGLMDYAFKYVMAKGITTESAYPYKARDQKCAVQGGAFKISKYTDVPSGSCSSLTNAVNQQPVSIGVDAETWQFYSGGVFSNCGTSLDHGVLAVGYDTSSNWFVKNSWGTSWGMKGYITLKSGNTCGICNTASYPTA